MKKLLFILSLILAFVFESCSGQSPDTFERLDGSVCVTLMSGESQTDSAHFYIVREVYAKGKAVRIDTTYFNAPLLGKDKFGNDKRYNFYYNRIGM